MVHYFLILGGKVGKDRLSTYKQTDRFRAPVSFMGYFSEKNIKKIVFTSSIILVGILTTVFGVLFVSDKYMELEEDLPKIETEFLEQQKEILQYAVHLQINQIDFHRKRMKSHLEERLKSRIVEARAIAHNVYMQNERKMSGKELQELVLQALRPIRFNQGRGYVFIFSMSGGIHLYPPNTDLEGSVAHKVFSEEKVQVIDGLRNVVQTKGEGFYEYDWPLPYGAPDELYRKLSYVTYFEPFDWFLGAGEYYLDFGEMTKENIASDITASMGPNPKNYFFVYDLHDINGGKQFATMIVNPNRPDLIGTKLSDDYRGARGELFRKKFLAGLRQKGEAFVTYWYKKAGHNEPKKKLSYFKLYPEWSWVVAKGVYLDDLDDIIQKEKELLQMKVKNKIVVFALLLLVAVICVVIIAHFFTKGINAIFVEYKEIQEKQHVELERINRYLHKRATTDNLTSLYNRQYFNDRLREEINRIERYKTPVSLILFDIDHFKQINDNFGHLAGDGVLKELSALIRSQIRQSDLVARWGGEEFVILLVQTDEEGSRVVAEKLRRMVADYTFPIDKSVTCSFGATTYIPREGSGDFINRADQALYMAKEGGRNRVEVL